VTAQAARPPHAETGLGALARLFLLLGVIGFGGPAAHIAMMREEVVRRRRWLDDARFLDLLGAVNLIPGPNSTELAIHIGYVRAGWRGLLVAGACFIAPAAALVLALAVLYERYGTTFVGRSLLYGIAPVVIAIVAQAIVGLLPVGAGTPLTAALAAAVFALYLIVGQELALLLSAGLVGAGARLAPRLARARLGSLMPAPLLLAATGASGIGLGGLFLTMLKIGAVLYGSGYVLITFLEGSFVGPGLLTERELVDAVTVGQVTPGPLFTTATFVGYLLHGVPGAALATLAIFLPSFVLVAAIGPLVPRLRRAPAMSGFLDGVNAAALGLMAGVLVRLAGEAIVDVPTALLFAAAAAVLILLRPASAWLVAAGAAAGIAVELVR
jgi:chromate transporter